MSDSVKKWRELQKENPTEMLFSPEEKREHDILELISLAVKSGKIAQVTERAEQVRHFVPPKQRLMEWCQQTHKQTPIYKEISRTGPSHDLTFTMGVWICGEMVAQGSGQKKKEATIATAINALERLGLTVPKPE